MNTTTVIPKDRFSYLVSIIMFIWELQLTLFCIDFGRQYPLL